MRSGLEGACTMTVAAIRSQMLRTSSGRDPIAGLKATYCGTSIYPDAIA